MITDISSYLKYFDSVRRRTERDVAALPPEAAAWRPPAGADGESGWSIGQIVGHIGSSRLYFASAYRGEGWIGIPATYQHGDRDAWLGWLGETADRFVELLKDTPPAWLTRRIEMIDTPGSTLSGWRILMMMLEHEVHHRSQIDSYAGLQGWPVPDIFGRSTEAVAARETEQRATYR
ncbi:MAG: hypothetical protein DMD81_12445 [Candidatus Rokuibacteriota bacterium]|nr:MAG: hypothetical protein DMD81_12445 [Candidatus Rokubacteria bacterium]